MSNLAIVGIVCGLLLLIAGVVIGISSEEISRIAVGAGLAWLGVGVIVVVGQRSET